jgi:hypothetical protein
MTPLCLQSASKTPRIDHRLLRQLHEHGKQQQVKTGRNSSTASQPLFTESQGLSLTEPRGPVDHNLIGVQQTESVDFLRRICPRWTDTASTLTQTWANICAVNYNHWSK